MPRLPTIGRTELKFATVVIVGYVIDLGTSVLAFNLLSLPLWASAGLGFAVALLVNFLLLEHWALKSLVEDEGRHSTRFLKYVLTSLATLLIRFAIVFGLDAIRLFGSFRELALLAAAAGSLVINYLAVRIFVFSR